jgi:hypothetical protein
MIYCHSNAKEEVLLLIVLIDHGGSTQPEVDILVSCAITAEGNTFKKLKTRF